MRLGRVSWIVFAHLLLILSPRLMVHAGSSSQEGETGSSEPPNPPELSGEAQSTASIQWTWTSVPEALFYSLHNAFDGSVIPGAGALATTSFPESGLSENIQYARYVRAHNDAGMSMPSNTVAKYTLVQSRDFILIAGDTTIDVSVNPPPNQDADMTGCRIERAGPTGDPGSMVVEVKPFSNVYEFPDTGLENDKEYCYTVTWRNGDGEIAISGVTKCETPTGTDPDCHTQLEIIGKPTYLPRGSDSGTETVKGNKFRAKVWWTGGDPGEMKTLTVTIKERDEGWLQGQSLNRPTSDAKTLPDYTMESSEQVEKDFWSISDGIPQYGGVQNLVVESNEPVLADEEHIIVISSYDWGGRCEIKAKADDCPEKTDRMPEDKDDDRLPDAWERHQWFWDVTKNKKKKYSTGSKNSSGTGPDADSDLDVGYGNPFFNHEDQIQNNPFTRVGQPEKVHTELGDGLSAFEEYRGLFVGGQHHRCDELLNDGGLQTNRRGPILKNVFIYDPNDLILRENNYQILHAVAYHRINLDEMTTKSLPGPGPGGMERVPGLINPNTVGKTKHQHGLWVEDKVPPGPPGILGEARGTGGPNTVTRPIWVNVGAIARDSVNVSLNGLKMTHSFQDGKNEITAHEVGHRLAMKHPTFVTVNFTPVDQKAAYVTDKYWPDDAPTATNKSFEEWSLVERLRLPTGATTETLLDGLTGPPNPATVIFRGKKAGVASKLHAAHDSIFHEAFVILWLTLNPQAVAGGSALRNPHTGDLMDAAHEHGDDTPRLNAVRLATLSITK